MRVSQKNNGVLLEGLTDFDITDTLLCGQVFRYKKTDSGFFIAAGNNAVNIVQTNKSLFFSPCGLSDFNAFWYNYFDLGRDYSAIKRELSHNDTVMQRAVKQCGGIRILNQNTLETLFSFIISQRMHIKRIRAVIEKLCAAFGEIKTNGVEYRAFPCADTLALLSVSHFAELGMGYRSQYLYEAAKAVKTGQVDLNPPKDKPVCEIFKELLAIKGVGSKVADCVLLFGFGKRERFPVDTWVSKAVCEFYFGGKSLSPQYINDWAADKFGGLSGYAQQYLFHYTRQLSSR